MTAPATQSTLLNTALIFATGNANAISITDGSVNGSNTVQLALSAANGLLTLSTTSGLTMTSGGNATAAMTVHGTLAAINAALSGLKFTAPANYAGAASLTLNYSDLGVAGTGPRTVGKTVAITVSYPVYTIVDQATGYAETAGTWATSSVNGYNGVATRSSSDANAAATWTPVLAAGTYQVSIYNPATAGATTDAKITVVHNGTSNVYTVNEASGTAGFINLGFLSFDGSGNESVSISQGTPVGTLYASAVQFARTGNIPVVTAPATQTTPVNTALIFSSANSNAISVADNSVNSNTVQLALSAISGQLTLSTTSGLTVTSGANGTAAMTVQGTLAAINTALSGLKFTVPLNYAGGASLSLNFSDLGVGGAGLVQTVSKTVAITVQYPTYTVVDQAAGYAETAGTWATSAVNGFNGVATRSSSSTNAAATWTPVLLAGVYQVSFYNPAAAGATTDAKITVVHNGTSNVYTVNEATGPAGYVTLGILSFSGNGSEYVSISQGGVAGTLYASAVQFARAGSIPAITAPATQTTAINTNVIFSSGGGNAISIADSSVNSNTVQLGLNAFSGQLTLSTTAGLTVISGANGTAAITVQGTLAAINAALSGLKFTVPLNYAGGASLTLTFSDLGGGGGGPVQTVSKTVAITVQYPVYTVVDQATGYAETAGTWATSSVNGFNGVATRSSSSTNAAATWTPALTAGVYQVSFYNPATAGATTDAKITVSHNGTSNVYTVNEATGTAGYITLGILSFNGSGSESVTISQGAVTGTLYASAVQFARAGSIPQMTVPTTTQNATLNTGLIFSAANSNAISISDSSVNSNTVQLALSSVNGVLTLSTTSGLAFTSGGNATAALTVQGTLAAINAALSGLKFTPSNNYAGVASMALTFSDLGGGGGGPVQTVSKTVAITVQYPTYTVVDQAAGYAETAGTWATSAVTGYNSVAARSSSDTSAAATWTPVLTAGTYQVMFYNPATAGATTDAKITIVHNGVTDVYTVNEATGTAGFVSLGFMTFNGSGNEYVSISQGATAGTLYASAVQFAQSGSIPVDHAHQRQRKTRP